MSPSPFAVTSPTDPASYSWEATDEGVAERFGIPVSQVLRFDLNTSPAPPAMLAGLLAADRFETMLSEYPPGDYRRLAEAAAARYGVEPDEVVAGRGRRRDPRHVHEGVPPAGEAAVISIPTYAMYRVHAEQRGATRHPRPAPLEGGRLGDGHPRGARGRGARGDPRLGLQPQQPDRSPEPDGAIETLLEGIAEDAAADGRPAPAVVVDEAYSEFSGPP